MSGPATNAEGATLGIHAESCRCATHKELGLQCAAHLLEVSTPQFASHQRPSNYHYFVELFRILQVRSYHLNGPQRLVRLASLAYCP